MDFFTFAINKEDSDEFVGVRPISTVADLVQLRFLKLRTYIEVANSSTVLYILVT